MENLLVDIAKIDGPWGGVFRGGFAEHLDACSDDTEVRGPWAPNSLARTCRALSEPALNWLWKTLPNIAPLVYTLPREFWTVENTDEIQLFTKTPIKIMVRGVTSWWLD